MKVDIFDIDEDHTHESEKYQTEENKLVVDGILKLSTVLNLIIFGVAKSDNAPIPEFVAGIAYLSRWLLVNINDPEKSEELHPDVIELLKDVTHMLDRIRAYEFQNSKFTRLDLVEREV